MTAKQYLQSYQRLERRYNASIEQIRTLETEMVSLRSPSFDERVQTSPQKDPIGEMVCNLEREKARLTMKMTECKSKMTIIKNQISELESANNDYCVILLFRYILFKDWKYICKNLHLSRSQANVIHGRALMEFDNKFNHFYSEK